jgi:hypothetical protein
MPAEAALSADIPDRKAVRLLRGRQFRRHRAWGGCRKGRRRLPSKRFVRPLMVDLLTEASDAVRLRAAVGRRRSGGVGFAGPVQACMPTMVLGGARLDECWEAPEAEPPGRALRQSGQGIGRARAPMSGAETAGQAEVLNHAGEDRLGLGHRGGGEGLAGQQATTIAIGHGEGGAGAAGAGFDGALQVSGPELRGRAHAGGRFPRLPDAAATALLGNQPVSAQELADGGACGPGPWRMALGAEGQQRRGPPVGGGRRAARMAATTASGVWRGQACGGRERSSKPAGPYWRERSIHLEPV